MHVILSDSEESSRWSRLLRFFVACRLLRMTVNGESLNLDATKCKAIVEIQIVLNI